MPSRLFVLDIETVGCADAASYVEPVQAPGNYKDPEKIAAYIKEETASRLAKVALDIDLAEIVALGLLPLADALAWTPDEIAHHVLTREGVTEDDMLHAIDEVLRAGAAFVTFNGRGYDLPVIARRYMYRDLPAPTINMDRYRSEHIDLYDKLSYYGAANAHKLSWYAKRFGWTDVTSRIEGKDVGLAVEDGDWLGIREHCACDLIWTARLAHQLGLA